MIYANNAMFLNIQGKGHSVVWNSARLVYKCLDFYKRRIIESTMIDSFPNMNIQVGSFSLNDFFIQ